MERVRAKKEEIREKMREKKMKSKEGRKSLAETRSEMWKVFREVRTGEAAVDEDIERKRIHREKDDEEKTDMKLKIRIKESMLKLKVEGKKEDDYEKENGETRTETNAVNIGKYQHIDGEVVEDLEIREIEGGTNLIDVKVNEDVSTARIKENNKIVGGDDDKILKPEALLKLRETKLIDKFIGNTIEVEAKGDDTEMNNDLNSDTVSVDSIGSVDSIDPVEATGNKIVEDTSANSEVDSSELKEATEKVIATDYDTAKTDLVYCHTDMSVPIQSLLSVVNMDYQTSGLPDEKTTRSLPEATCKGLQTNNIDIIDIAGDFSCHSNACSTTRPLPDATVVDYQTTRDTDQIRNTIKSDYNDIFGNISGDFPCHSNTCSGCIQCEKGLKNVKKLVIMNEKRSIKVAKRPSEKVTVKNENKMSSRKCDKAAKNARKNSKSDKNVKKLTDFWGNLRRKAPLPIENDELNTAHLKISYPLNRVILKQKLTKLNLQCWILA